MRGVHRRIRSLYVFPVIFRQPAEVPEITIGVKNSDPEDQALDPPKGGEYETSFQKPELVLS